MFERFTDKARTAVNFAQMTARDLQHTTIDTPAVLIGLLTVQDGVAAKALFKLEITRDSVCDLVREQFPPQGEPPGKHIPFAPTAKKSLELALREALTLGHNYIGTEHLLLGLVRGDNDATQVLTQLGAEPARVRKAVIDTLIEMRNTEVVGVAVGEGISSARRRQRSQPVATGPTCSSCKVDLSASARYTIAEVAEQDGDGHAQVLFLFCGSCGEMIDNLILPGI